MGRIGNLNGTPFCQGDTEASKAGFIHLPQRPLWHIVLIFAMVFVTLQTCWSASRNTWVERLVVHVATVRPASAMINVLTPAIKSLPDGARIRAKGGGLNILNGCEGTEVAFLLIAAFAATRMRWRVKLAGLGVGVVLVWGLNQARVLALFYSFRHDRAIFNILHTTVAPVLLVIAVALFFQLWLRNANPAR